MGLSVLRAKQSFVDTLREVLVENAIPGYRDGWEKQRRLQAIAIKRLQEPFWFGLLRLYSVSQYICSGVRETLFGDTNA